MGEKKHSPDFLPIIQFTKQQSKPALLCPTREDWGLWSSASVSEQLQWFKMLTSSYCPLLFLCRAGRREGPSGILAFKLAV